MTYTTDLESDANQSLVSTTIAEANHVEVIETVISSLQEDQSAMVSQTEQGHLWKFKYGSVEVYVQLSGTSDEDMLIVWSPVLKLPVKNEPQLLRKLLELNWSSTFEAHFGIVENQVVVSSQRSVAELSPGEVSRNITVVATVADDHDEALTAEFGHT
ncbi:YbjN domain-containing protein [Oscillatoria sp. FACHB-1407]|uniref:YbjN domain-containing protein n=1 Tax=Oscillatoria sp. FACHB-1407 TaxID=2692847 RepID=UPI0016895E20|nr:YbjN domain-containing protein [Oscillatoria sp. FACHB-1407]MBD2465057.1 YbjN domain-containing protein [Oscillatoria sp. FACHB-1407]